MQTLSQFTFFINYATFILVLWLGLYLVMHNPKYPISWLTALTLWSLATLFLHYLMEPTFLPGRDLELGSNRWFQGLAVAPALAFWHHATMLMRPKKLNPWRWARILAAYLLAVGAIVFQASTQVWSRTAGGNLLYLNSRQAGPLYPIFGGGLLVFIVASMINLVRSARATPASLPHKQLLTLAWATLVAGLSGPAMMIGMFAGLPIPTMVISLLLSITVGLIGYGVARYSALMQGRTIHRDFFYNLVVIALVGAVYIPVCWTLMKVYQASPVIFILIPTLAVFTHSLITPAYRMIDRLYLRRETRQMRTNLQRLSRLAFDGDQLAENLDRAFMALCHSVRAMYGIVLTLEGNSIRPISRSQWSGESIDLPSELFKADDVKHLSPGQLPKPLEEAALLVPLYRENDQFGVIVLGHPANGPRYAEEDIDRILNPAEMIGEAIYSHGLRTELMGQVAQLAGTRLMDGKSVLPVEIVENAFRNLGDYAFLADSPLAELGLVQFRLPRKPVTHLDRGKVVHDILLETLNKLNPGTAIPRDPPPREWYPYQILKEAYIDGVTNRDIMMHLYISEGTFNRTRRAAVRSVARALAEMENSLR